MGQYSGVDREPIWAALFALLQAQVGSSYTVLSRHHVQPPQLAAEMQPALFLVQSRETRSSKPPGTPVRLLLSGFLVIYFQAPIALLDGIGAEIVVGATALNALLKGIDDAFQPDDVCTGKLTLGGLVTHCWLEGDVDMDTGIYTQQGAAILPIRILVP